MWFSSNSALSAGRQHVQVQHVLDGEGREVETKLCISKASQLACAIDFIVNLSSRQNHDSQHSYISQTNFLRMIPGTQVNTT